MEISSSSTSMPAQEAAYTKLKVLCGLERKLTASVYKPLWELRVSAYRFLWEKSKVAQSSYKLTSLNVEEKSALDTLYPEYQRGPITEHMVMQRSLFSYMLEVVKHATKPEATEHFSGKFKGTETQSNFDKQAGQQRIQFAKDVRNYYQNHQRTLRSNFDEWHNRLSAAVNIFGTIIEKQEKKKNNSVNENLSQVPASRSISVAFRKSKIQTGSNLRKASSIAHIVADEVSDNSKKEALLSAFRSRQYSPLAKKLFKRNAELAKKKACKQLNYDSYTDLKTCANDGYYTDENVGDSFLDINTNPVINPYEEFRQHSLSQDIHYVFTLFLWLATGGYPFLRGLFIRNSDPKN